MSVPECPLDTLAQAFHLTSEEAEELLLISLEADRALAIETFGYPKDNHIPAPMHERLLDPRYRQRLLDELLARYTLDPGCPLLGRLLQALALPNP